jgi:tRNA (guanine-N7-)-methyltransferase
MKNPAIDTVRFNFDFYDNLFLLSFQIKPQIRAFAEYEKVNSYMLFGNNNPMNIEIGTGNGEFLEYMAKKRCAENFIGFEIIKKVFSKAVNRMKRSALKNVRLIHYDGVFFIKMLANNSIKDVYINFPDPWPKRKHNKRRLINTDFLKLIGEKIIPDGLIYIVTDHREYAAQIAKNFEFPGFKSTFDKVCSNKLIDYFETKYYRKFAYQNAVYFFKVKKSY